MYSRDERNNVDDFIWACHHNKFLLWLHPNTHAVKHIPGKLKEKSSHTHFPTHPNSNTHTRNSPFPDAKSAPLVLNEYLNGAGKVAVVLASDLSTSLRAFDLSKQLREKTGETVRRDYTHKKTYTKRHTHGQTYVNILLPGWLHPPKREERIHSRCDEDCLLLSSPFPPSIIGSDQRVPQSSRVQMCIYPGRELEL